MKRTYKFAAVFAAVVMTASLMCGCDSSESSKTSTAPTESSLASNIESQTSGKTLDDHNSNSADISNIDETEQSSQENIDVSITSDSDENNESSVESSEENSNKVSDENSDEISDENSNENSDTENSNKESSVSENENSDQTSSEISENETSETGYHFDDEQIVEDYHTANVFTSDETFNDIFSENEIDKSYQEELKEIMTVSDMRNAAQNYAKIWKEKVDVIYSELSEILEKNESEKESLLKSQNEWLAGLEDTENEFYAQASKALEEGQEIGTDELLSADTAVMNYYKARAAVLLEQIYVINGDINLSDYGL